MGESNDLGLENLQLWQKAVTFAARVYQDVLPRLPAEEKWAMASQLRRAAQSIPANIAEGHGRFYYQDNIRFCYIARGSLEDILSQLTLARRLNYPSESDLESLKSNIYELRRMLNGYISFLKTSKHGANEPGAMITVRDDSFDYLVDEHPETTSDFPID